MDYREHPPSEALTGLVKTYWSLAAGEDPETWIEHQAVPDGCVEIIRRLDGSSRWDGNQPECFAVGLIDAPSSFEISGSSRFAAIRLWPWAWPLLSDIPLAQLRNRWMGIEAPALQSVCEALPDFAETDCRLEKMLAAATGWGQLGLGLVEAETVAEMARATDMNPRQLQRWFARQVGLPPRRYLRLLRFQKAFAEVSGQESLAEHAAEHGFADQAHMAREFRSLAGAPAKSARRTARGPFLR